MSVSGEDDAENAGQIPACVFVRPGDSPRTVFGRKSGGSLVHITSAEPGVRDIFCPECGTRLVAKLRGIGRVQHFSHYQKGECASAGETALHRIAKEIIRKSGKLKIPEYQVDLGDRTPELVQTSDLVAFDEVEVESWQDGFRPDLIGTLTGPGGEPLVRLVIEIRVTHAVDRRKLEILRQRGDSVVEIDLSGVGRNLEGPELVSQILRDAPRHWLYHRKEDEFERRARAQQAKRDAARERKKAYAISMAEKEEKDRQADMARAPSLYPPEVEWADTQRRNWTLIGMEEIFDIPGGDGVFDVPTHLWRAYVFSVFAPWRETRFEFGFQPDPERICTRIAAGLKAKAWVKPRLASPYKVFECNRSRQVDPAFDAVEALTRDGLLRYGFSDPRDYTRPGYTLAQSAAQKAWEEHLGWRRAVLRLSRVLASRGVVMKLGGEEPKVEADVDRLALTLQGVDRSAYYVEDFISDITRGRRGALSILQSSTIEGQGLVFSLPNSTSSDPTTEALEYLALKDA